MPHYCRHCERYLPNERFTGRGHHQHLCKDCSRRPKSEIQKADQLREIANFLKQSHISSKNCERLAVLTESGDKDVSQLAELIGRVASVCPYKRRRLKNLARKNRELIRLLEEAGLIFPSFHREYGDEWNDDLDKSLDPFSESDLGQSPGTVFGVRFGQLPGDAFAVRSGQLPGDAFGIDGRTAACRRRRSGQRPASFLILTALSTPTR